MSGGGGVPAHGRWARAFVAAVAIAASALLAWVLFAGPYLPYTDWSKHAALIEILAHGDVTGADAYWERTLRPTPYWFFYVATAALTHLAGVDADVRGRLVLVLAAALLVLAHAHLLRECGRDMRWCVVAPIALFGLALGYGFGSFLCATPAALFTFARTEALLRRRNPRNVLLLAGAHLLVLLGHGLWVLAVAVAVTIRAAVFAAACRRRGRAFPWQTLGAGLLSTLPAVALGVVMALRPVVPAERFSTFWVGADVQERLGWMKRAFAGQFIDPRIALLLAIAVAGFFCAMVLLAARAHSVAAAANDEPPLAEIEDVPRWGLETYAAVLLLLALAGPKSLGGPIQVYLIYPRFLAVAIVLASCVPRVQLRGVGAWLVFAWASVTVVCAGGAQRDVVVRASQAAADFDSVRTMVPRSSLVLALWAPDAGDPLLAFPGFWPGFWLGVDGAQFSAGLFNFAAHPVFRKINPAAPRETRGLSFQPDVHGRDWEYLVVRGRKLIDRIDAAPRFAPVGTSGGYRVYRNTQPPKAAGQPRGPN